MRVGLVQINNSFSSQNYLPLSVGMLQAYAEANLPPDDYEFLLPIYKRIPVDDAVEQLKGAHIVFFSVYVWGYRISLEIARRLKEKQPFVQIVFGGPHVPDHAEVFLREHRFVDVACHGEGEQPFLGLLRGDTDVPGTSYLAFTENPAEEYVAFHTNQKPARIADLGIVPSPYLTGVFEPLMRANPYENWIALWETNRGCPFSCTFCDWGSAVQAKVHNYGMDRLKNEIQWFAQHRIEFLFCCDANFGIMKRDVELAEYIAHVKQWTSYPHAMSVQNTKNATEQAYLTQKILSDAGLNKGVDLAIQSTHPDTLVAVKRANISQETYRELQRRFTRDGVETFTDVILGLPGESYDSYVDGISSIIENGQHNRIQFNNLTVLPNAEMGNPAYIKHHGIETVEQQTINIHGTLVDEEIIETQQLVVATNTMPKEDWVRTRMFSWMAAFLHFNKVLQIPLILTHELCGVSYRDLIEAFLRPAPESLPVLAEIQSIFRKQVEEILQGGADFTRSEEWLNLWWPTDEYVLIKLCTEHGHWENQSKLDRFYVEAEIILTSLARQPLPPSWLRDSINLNRYMMKRPFQTDDIDIDCDHNIWEFYQSVLKGRSVPLENTPNRYHIDRTSETWHSWEDWCREVIWYGNKRGAYLYGNRALERELAGHF
jgi:radical SAM superfamily enzyme YgiQ (UPF0313 family)